MESFSSTDASKFGEKFTKGNIISRRSSEYLTSEKKKYVLQGILIRIFPRCY
jgi:hypothetical protein